MEAGFVRVLATHSWLQGGIVKGRLEAEGVPVELTATVVADETVAPLTARRETANEVQLEDPEVLRGAVPRECA